MKRKFLFTVIAVLTVLSTVLSASPVLAGDGNNGNGKGQSKIEEKIKLFADRQAAAANLRAAKDKAKDAGADISAVTIVDNVTGLMIPDYFGVANWANSPALTKFVDKLPGLGPAAANALGQFIPIAVPDTTTFATPPSDYYEIALVEYKEQMHSQLPSTTLRGYVQIVPASWNGTDLLGNAYRAVPLTIANGLTQDIMIGGVQAYGASKPHYLGPAIVAMGALQGVGAKPVRIKFYNLLPTGAGGDLFIPVDATVMGAGMYMADYQGNPAMGEFTQNRATLHLHGNNTVWISDGTPHQWITPAGENPQYPQGVSVVPVPDMASVDNGDPNDGVMTFFYSNAQSARLQFYHDHSYGITRLNVYVGEAAAYVITDTVEQDIINGTNNSGVNPGLLKVLPGIGIPLVIQDKTFVDPSTIGATDPTWLDPLQKTYGTNPGTAVAGDLWYPHTYVPAQNPWDVTGTNPFGRWMYGPWFYPPTTGLLQGPVPNPYCLPYPPGQMPGHIGDLNFWDNSAAPWEPPFMPGVPYPSMPGEAFMDTQLVNGTVYPYMELEPKAYRFRILNAGDDRFVNLQLYKATGIVGSTNVTSGGSGYTVEPAVTITPGLGDITGHGAQAFATIDTNNTSATFGQVTAVTITVVGSNYTVDPVVTIDPPLVGTTATATATVFTLNASGFGSEVGMVPVTGTDWLPPFDMSGIADPANAGPDWWQIGTEGGFLPEPVVVPAQPITWNTNPTTFNFGTVNGHSLLLGTAERADVIVDFSAFAGQTLILYNDAPAAFPAPVPTYDYYTNDQDLTGVGGAPTTPPGVGPNTRTIMQIRVGTTVTPGTETPDVTLANLQAVWAKTAGKRGVFEVSQDPIIIPQAAYNSAYGVTNFPTSAAQQYIQIFEHSKTFQPINANGALQPAVTLPIEPKGAHDEMGGVFDTKYGRMSGMLGLQIPANNAGLTQFLAYGYASPPVDIIGGSVSGTLVGTLNDGTQIWNITHNGVDTHTIHTHLANAQVVNRVGWDGIMLPPDPSELGWKETFRMNPLEMIFLAIRPILPTSAEIPFIDQVPNSVRLIDPTMPAGDPLDPPPPAGWFDPNGVAITSIPNHKVNLGWEYMYHCHILAHEEMDMMHSLNMAVAPKAPTNLGAAVAGSGAKTSVVLTWTDNSPNETNFIIQRATNTSFTTELTPYTVGPNVATYTNLVGNTKKTFFYRVFATNVVGDTATPGFPVTTVNSGFSNLTAYPIGTPVTPPAAPTNVTATAARQGGNERVTVSWTGSTGAQTYRIQIASTAAFGATIVAVGNVNAPTATFTSGNLPRAPYYVRVMALNAAGLSAWVHATLFPVPAP